MVDIEMDMKSDTNERLNDATRFGAWLKERRKALDLTQQDLAERVGCAAVTIRKIERGHLKPSRQITELLAETLHIAPDNRTEFLGLARGRGAPHPGELAGTGQPGQPEPSSPESKAHSTLRNNLPRRLTALIGRESVIEEVMAWLLNVDTPYPVRLLTLTGPPGIGKTSLSLELAKEALHSFQDGVFFVPLASISDPELLFPTMVQALGLKTLGKQAPLTQLTDYLQDKQVLLVLDNFEQIISSAPLLPDLLSSCPRLTLLVTSRELLRVRGERHFPVSPLEVPSSELRVSGEPELVTPKCGVTTLRLAPRLGKSPQLFSCGAICGARSRCKAGFRP